MNVIKNRIFQSEMRAEGFREYMDDMEAEMEAYEAKVSAAAQSLAAQFPDTPVSKWRSAIDAATSGSREVRFTSEEKSTAFNKALRGL